MSEQQPKRPTTDELAGVYVDIAGEEKVTDAARRRPAQPLPPPDRPPTTDELAGVYVEIAGPEKIYPRKQPPPPPPTTP
jgi:hypothetical protein